MKFIASLSAAAVLAIASGLTPAVAAPAPQAAAFAPSAVANKFKNCTALNKVYPHGVGKAGARDKTSSKPVTNFKKSTALYNKVISFNHGLDRDHDGIACEKK